MRAVVVLVCCAVLGCDSDRCVVRDPQWELVVSPTGSSVLARARADGSSLLLVQHGDAQIGDSTVTGPYLIGVSATGQLGHGASITMPLIRGYREFAIDELGGAVIEGETNYAPIDNLDVTAYDAVYGERWTLRLTTLENIDTAPNGAAVYNGRKGASPAAVHYLDAAGTEQWSIPAVTNRSPSPFLVRISNEGDVFVFDDNLFTRRRYTALGALIEEIQLDDFGYLPSLQRDGSLVSSRGMYQSEVMRIDANGQLWINDLRAVTGAPVATSSGDVVVITASGTQVVRLDRTTGTIKAMHENCTTGELVYADDTGYVVLGDGHLARYVGP